MLDNEICPECGYILSYEGMDNDSDLFRCDCCKVTWIRKFKTKKLIVDDPDRIETRYYYFGI